MTDTETKENLRRIHETIRAIEDPICGLSFDKFCEHRFMHLVVERGVEIVSEVSARLPDTFKADHPDIDWERFASLAAQLRRDSSKVDVETLWDVFSNALPALRASTKRRSASRCGRARTGGSR